MFVLSTLDRTARLRAALDERESNCTLRRLRSIVPVGAGEIILDGKPMINFACNDYMGLSEHPLLKARAIEYIHRYGVGAPSSRLISGNIDIYDRIEARIARLKETEAALIFSSGYLLNSTVIPSLFGAESVLAVDRLAHNSMLTGMETGKAGWFRFKHNDMADLQAKMSWPRFGAASERWILTESVFSMDGDRADLDAAAGTALAINAGLFVDEAHATGVFGANGMGLVTAKHGADLVMGTFGKGLGSFGAYIACSTTVRQYILNFCPGIIYSTALPPPVLGAIDAALDLLPEMEQERTQLLERATHLRDRIQSLGFDTAQSTTQIIPLVVGSDEGAVALSTFLEDKGIFAPAVRTPTVPSGEARVRVSLSRSHTSEHVLRLLDLLRGWHEKRN